MLVDFRREPGVLRRRVEEEVQGADGILFRRQAPVLAAAQVDQVHQIRVRRRRAHATEVDVGNTDSQVRATVAGELRVGVGGWWSSNIAAAPRRRPLCRDRCAGRHDDGGYREQSIRFGLVVRLRRGVRVRLSAVRHYQTETAEIAIDGHHATAHVFDGDIGGSCRRRRRSQFLFFFFFFLFFVCFVHREWPTETG